MTTKKDLFEDLLDSIINSDSFESADKAKKLKKAWSEEESYHYDKNGSRIESDGHSDGHSYKEK